MNSDKQLSIGLIGCGAIGEVYHLPALRANPQTRNQIHLVDTSATRLEKIRQEFGAVWTGTDYRELVGKVDGVIIATPPLHHFAATKFFLENGIPVICEKPLTESSEEARELVAIARQHSTALAVNHTRRFFPTYQKIRELIANGVLGKLESIKYHDGVDSDWPAASAFHFQPKAKGVWSDIGVHLLDAVCYWIGGKPELIRSQNDSHGGPEAMATVNLEHEGCQIELKVSRLGHLMNGFEIAGSLGSIKAAAEDWDEFTVEFRDGRSQRHKCGSAKAKFNDFGRSMLANFVDVITDQAVPTASGESVVGVIELLEEAYAKAERYSMPWNESLSSWPEEAVFADQGEGKPRRVLVTGASGFVGGRVSEMMELTGLFEPVAAIRRWSRAARVAMHPMQIVVCDIMNPEQVDAAVKEVDAIVHCAYVDDRNSIVEGTRNLLEAAVRHGVSNFVFLSSAEVYGPDRLGTVSDNIPLTPPEHFYGAAKLEAEGVCRSYESRGVKVTVLRPSIVYGPQGESFSIGIAERLQSGNWGVFEGLGEGTVNLIYIDDLARAIFLALRSKAKKFQVFNVNSTNPPTWNEYFQRFNEALGLPPLKKLSTSKSKLRSMSMDLVRKVTSTLKAKFEDQIMDIYLRGGLAGRMMKRLKNRLDSTPNGRELTDMYSRKAYYSDEKIRSELGFEPAFDLDRALATTLRWMLLHELIESPEKVQMVQEKSHRSVPQQPVTNSI